MKLVFEGPIQAGALFTKDGSEPFQLVICSKNTDGCIEIHMSNDDAKEIMNCLQESFSDEPSTPPAPDPRDTLLERAAKLIKSVIDNDPHAYWPNGDAWLAAWQKFKEEVK